MLTNRNLKVYETERDKFSHPEECISEVPFDN